MTKIKARDSFEYSYPPEVIFPILADITGYKKWWPREFRVKVLQKEKNYHHSKIEVWASGGWFRCETQKTAFPERIDICYYQGVVLGDSWWEIEPLAKGRTRVSYEIDLEPNGILMNMVVKVINISALHSFQFKRVLKKLNTYLAHMVGEQRI